MQAQTGNDMGDDVVASTTYLNVITGRPKRPISVDSDRGDWLELAVA
jgi:hypothetical protein